MIWIGAAPALGTWPGANGEILFSRVAGSGERVTWHATMEDGSGTTRVDLPARAGSPVWSPDGSTLAYPRHARRASTGLPLYRRISIRLFDAGTGGSTLVIGDADLPERLVLVTDLAFGPTGDRVAFCVWNRNLEAEVFTVGVDGSNLARISSNDELCSMGGLDWSSTNRIVTDAGVTERTELVTMAPDGSNVEVLVDLPPDLIARFGMPTISPSWAPDGSAVVFHSASDRRQSDIWIVDADGTDARRLTDSRKRWELMPLFSPDGEAVVYSAGPKPFVAARDLWVDALLGGRARVTDTARSSEFAASWRPA